ncbi:MAG: HIRAN domain-containing protein [Sulfuricella denitrificans]|nr:HIRAN domain-containing protein [Sulfuricella denitrificans]
MFTLLAGADSAWAQEPVAEAKIYLQSSRLAGFKFYEGRKLWPQMRSGDALKLVREADNPYDANAISVEWQDHKLGHVPRMENAALARFMDHGQQLEARITALAKEKRRGRWIEFDVYMEH